MDLLWTILGGILMLAGLAGCILPFLPGPPLCFAALLLQQFKADKPYDTNFLIWWAVVTGLVTLLDYVVPVYGTKKFGGTRYGLWGCTIGLIIGFWFGLPGIIIGPFLGALVGELIANNSGGALKAALGSFIGFLVGMLLKLVVCCIMLWQFVKVLW
ncbi:MAG: DUF456 domain-containing protein [Bacteroidota bacterium]